MLASAELRPDHHVAPSFPATVTPELGSITAALTTVILRNAREGLPTTWSDFRDAPETRGFSPQQVERHLEAARRAADQIVIRQEALALEPADRPDLDALSTDQLLEIALPLCTTGLTQVSIATALLAAGLKPAAVARVWPRLMVALATQLAAVQRPSLPDLARLARQQH